MLTVHFGPFCFSVTVHIFGFDLISPEQASTVYSILSWPSLFSGLLNLFKYITCYYVYIFLLSLAKNSSKTDHCDTWICIDFTRKSGVSHYRPSVTPRVISLAGETTNAAQLLQVSQKMTHMPGCDALVHLCLHILLADALRQSLKRHGVNLSQDQHSLKHQYNCVPFPS